MALHFGAAAEGRVSGGDRLAGRLWRVCHQGSRRGGSTVGDKEMQTAHELWQTEPGAEVFQEKYLHCCYQIYPEVHHATVYINCCRVGLNPHVSLFHVSKNGKIKVGLFFRNVNTLNFSLSVDVLMESSPLSCQIKNSIGISKLSPSVKLLGLLLQYGETPRYRTCRRWLNWWWFTLSAVHSPNCTHSFLMQIHTTPILFPHPLFLFSFGLLLMGAVVRV